MNSFCKIILRPNYHCVKYRNFTRISRFARNYAEAVPFHKISTPGYLGEITVFCAVYHRGNTSPFHEHLNQIT